MTVEAVSPPDQSAEQTEAPVEMFYPRDYLEFVTAHWPEQIPMSHARKLSTTDFTSRMTLVQPSKDSTTTTINFAFARDRVDTTFELTKKMKKGEKPGGKKEGTSHPKVRIAIRWENGKYSLARAEFWEDGIKTVPDFTAQDAAVNNAIDTFGGVPKTRYEAVLEERDPSEKEINDAWLKDFQRLDFGDKNPWVEAAKKSRAAIEGHIRDPKAAAETAKKKTKHSNNGRLLPGGSVREGEVEVFIQSDPLPESSS